MYALDWQHSAFRYNPRINGEYDYYMIYDKLENTRAYFPDFYPNGDYYFFVSKDYSWGYLTHPWQKRAWVYGFKLMELMRKHANEFRFKPCTSL